MNSLFLWIEATRLSVWLRESTSVLAYPAILSAHAIGMGFAVGVNAAIALRLLGVASGVEPSQLRRFAPVMWLGFWINAVSGLLLLLAYPTKALTNPVFYAKLLLIAAGMWIYAAMLRRLDSGTGRWLAATSLACWVAAITTGRLLAYTAKRILATW